MVYKVENTLQAGVGKSALGQASRKETLDEDYRRPRIIILKPLSDLSKSDDWDVVQNQWEITSYEYFPEGTGDSFNTGKEHVQHLYGLTNTKTGKKATMGSYDIESLFFDGKHRLRSFKRSGGMRIDTKALDLRGTDFWLRFLAVVKLMNEKAELDLAHRFACLGFLIDFLDEEDREKFVDIVNCLAPPNEFCISSRDGIFIRSKPDELCTNYYGLDSVPDAKIQRHNEIVKEMDRRRCTIQQSVSVHTRSKAAFDTAFDRELRKEKENLENQPLTYLEIYNLALEHGREIGETILL